MLFYWHRFFIVISPNQKSKESRGKIHMIKLTELKRMIKSNSLRKAFYTEGLTNVIFNYDRMVLIELKQCDQLKLFNYLKSINYVDDEYSFGENELHTDSELKNKLEKLKGNTSSHTQCLVDTGIQFNKKGLWADSPKVIYKVFKTKKGLMKIKDEYICMLNQDIKKGVVLKTNEAHSMIFIYNNTNDCIGVTMGEKFEMDELIEYTQWGS